MNFSYYEVYVNALRAFSGMGFPYGADEDAAFIIAWLELNNLYGVKLFVNSIDNIDRKYDGKIKLSKKQSIIDFKKYHGTILATGSEVEIANLASIELAKEGINVRVVSIPCFEIFNEQSKEYQESIIGSKKCFAVEAGVIKGWEKYVSEENFLGMKTFGASGPYKELYEHFGITVKNLVNKIKNNTN